MELLASEGNVAGAVAFFERYRNRLLREYEVDPSDDLLDFVEGLGRSGAAHQKLAAKVAPGPEAAATTSASQPPIVQPSGSGVPVIAVVALSAAHAADPLRHLSDAFTHELVSTLCRFKEWTVTMPGALTEANLQAVPDAALDELSARGVDFALLTSVAAVAGTTVINVRLVECGTRAVVISDQYPASSENWLAALNDICCRIASRTKTSLIAARLRKSTGKSVEQLQAYDLWLEGEVLTDLWERDTEEKAIELFSRAVQLDGNLASAYAGWASVLNSRWIMYPGLPADAENREQAYQLAKKAVALDPLNTQSQGNLGWCHILAGRFDPAELHFGLAYELNPSNPDNLLSCALAYAFCGNHERARQLCRRAFELNPFPQPYYHAYRASIDFLARDFGGCIEAVNRAPDFFPDIQGWAAASYGHLGDLDAGRAALDRYFVDIRKRWAGPPNPSDDALCDWFVNVFPIRYEADRRLLADGLDVIRAQPRQKRRS
jgi:tetratricopeptide (TPR) repeat protein